MNQLGLLCPRQWAELYTHELINDGDVWLKEAQ